MEGQRASRLVEPFPGLGGVPRSKAQIGKEKAALQRSWGLSRLLEDFSSGLEELLRFLEISPLQERGSRVEVVPQVRVARRSGPGASQRPDGVPLPYRQKRPSFLPLARERIKVRLAQGDRPVKTGILAFHLAQ